MLTFKEAKEKMKKYLSSMEDDTSDEKIDIVIVDDLTIEEDFGWVFFYNSKEFIETGNLSYALVGNAPVIINKYDGTLHETGTASQIGHYIEEYKKRNL